VPGLYRLDQCDEDGNELDDAQPAYVSIDVARNAQVATDARSGDVNPLVIIQQMAAIQADVMKTMAAHQAALLAATAEIMRAPYRPALVAAPTPELRNADSEGGDEDDVFDDETDEESQPASALVSVARMVDATMPNVASQLGKFLYEKIFELMNKKKAAAGVAAMPSPVAAQTPNAPPPTAAAVSASVASPVDEVADVETAASIIPMQAATSVVAAPDEQLEMVAPNASDLPPVMPPAPTPAQMAHLFAIRERLDAKERAIAEAAVHRMTPVQLAHWLGELSEESVEDATAAIRDLIDQIRPNAQCADQSTRNP
jgi:hypothetical protein